MFHSNLQVNKTLIKNFPNYFRGNFNTWDSKLFSSFSELNIIFAGQLFNTDGAVKPWEEFQEEYGLKNKLKFKWIQLIHSSPKP